MNDSMKRGLIGLVSVLVLMSSAAFYHPQGEIPWLLIIGALILSLAIGVGWGIWSARREDDVPMP